MSYDPVKHHRRPMRLRDYDYSQAGAYFVTICTEGRQCVLGEVVDGEMRLSAAGQIVNAEFVVVPTRFPGIEVDEYVVMPNHVHVVFVFVGAQFIAPKGVDITKEDAMNRAPTLGEAVGVELTATEGVDMVRDGAIHRAPTLGEVVRSFKAVTTRHVRLSTKSDFSWQRNYYEHVIRNEDDLRLVREYFQNNPLKWDLDRENPSARQTATAFGGRRRSGD